ncbi:MAG: hypothetical protein KC433_16415 [Anaerolineales bacterium]|nr:hypothetical protein [Anaerolineales bacterium]MCB8940030.1 hypothetical protein [Ardenticatenaceae bacterium]
MKPRNPFIVAAVIFFLGFTIVAAYLAFEIWGLIFVLFTLLLFAFVLLLALLPRYRLIDEMEVGVIYNRFNNSFCRFYPETDPDPRFGCKEIKVPFLFPFISWWIQRNDPHYVRLRWYEKLADEKITKKSQSASGKLEDIRTADGVLVDVTWKVSFTVNVYALTDNVRYKLARTLPENADKVVKGKAERAIKHLVETYLAEELYDKNAIKKLEAEVAQSTNELLAEKKNPYDPDSAFKFNLGFQPIPDRDVSLGPIEMPTDVEKTLEIAYQRKIHTQMVTEAMNRLKEAVSNFSDEEMKRLEKLEKLRILDAKDVESIHLAKVFIGKQDS